MTTRQVFKLARGVAWGVAFGAAASAVTAQQPQPAAGGGRGGAAQPLVVHQLKPNVYWVEGAGGNSAVIVGANGVVVVDAKTSAAGATELLADIAKITPKPVTTVFLTHSDGDHVNGLASFPKGVTIIAQENCKTEMQAAPNAAAGGALADYMPTRTVTRNMEDMTIEGVHLRAYHFTPAHTSGDLMVYLPDDKIMFTGDIVATQSAYALIHLEKNGTSDGWVTTMNGILATDATTFVPGHGDVQTKTDLQKRVADVTARRDQIKTLVGQGKSLDDVRASLGEQPPAARGGGGGGGGTGRGAAFPNFQDFTAVIVAEQTRK
jgi:glyoxylase-like metal-dependent hydrolase (beta-lactamase superfamily II)